MKTSHTHPLHIAEVYPGPAMGKIGITFCPGKRQPDAMTGSWARDLDTDLDAISSWGAVAVVTLIERAEMRLLNVANIGDKVAARHMVWHHLPIRDVTMPGPEFEASWREVGERLRHQLRSGFNVLVHCKGGLGRAGTIAARLLTELGWKPDRAIAEVRRVRPGAIETAAQERHVCNVKAFDERERDTSLEGMRDRAVGAFLGLAVGDAIGTTLEFSGRDSLPLLTGMAGGGPFQLQPGEWTDDTAMALALGDSLEDCDGLDPKDLMRKFVSWRDEGSYSCTGKCFDIGLTTSSALSRFKRTGDPLAGSTDPETAGNGSLMRLAPVAVRHFRQRDAMRSAAELQSRTTHAAPEAVDACVAFAEMLADAINGWTPQRVISDRGGSVRPWAGRIEAIMAGSWRSKARNEIRSSGYVAHSLEAALWCVGRTGSFAEAVLLAANLGDDADTTAAITGQLAGALYGARSIPQAWRETVTLGARIEAMAGRLFDAGTR